MSSELAKAANTRLAAFVGFARLSNLFIQNLGLQGNPSEPLVRLATFLKET
jgi:hypothetical protein